MPASELTGSLILYMQAIFLRTQSPCQTDHASVRVEVQSPCVTGPYTSSESPDERPGRRLKNHSLLVVAYSCTGPRQASTQTGHAGDRPIGGRPEPGFALTHTHTPPVGQERRVGNQYWRQIKPVGLAGRGFARLYEKEERSTAMQCWLGVWL